MRHVLLFLCITIIIILFASCADNPEYIPEITETLAPTSTPNRESFEASQTPRLIVSIAQVYADFTYPPHQTLRRAREGTANWTFINRDGYTVSIMSDSLSPLQLSERDLEQVTLFIEHEISELYFQFTPHPSISVTVFRWNTRYLGTDDIWTKYERFDLEPGVNTIIIIDDGYDYIYGVDGIFSQGRVEYAFRTISTLTE